MNFEYHENPDRPVDPVKNEEIPAEEAETTPGDLQNEAARSAEEKNDDPDDVFNLQDDEPAPTVGAAGAAALKGCTDAAPPADSNKRWWKRGSERGKASSKAEESSQSPQENVGIPALGQGGGGDGSPPEVPPPSAADSGDENDDGGRRKFPDETAERHHQPDANDEVADFLLSKFKGKYEREKLEEPQEDQVDKTGQVMAALVEKGDTKGFTHSLSEIAQDPGTRARILRSALSYSGREALPTIFAEINKIDFETLPYETVLETTAQVSTAITREFTEEEDKPQVPWQNLQLNPDVIVSPDVTTNISTLGPLDPELIANHYRSTAYISGTPEEYAAGLTGKIIDLVSSEAGQRDKTSGEEFASPGAELVQSALSALNEQGLHDQEKALARQVSKQPGYSDILFSHIRKQFASDNKNALKLYDVIQENRADLAYMTILDAERAIYQARNGDLVEALSFAENHPSYTDRMQITLSAADYLQKAGDEVQAVTLLKEALELNPLEVEPYEIDAFDESDFDLEDDSYRGRPAINPLEDEAEDSMPDLPTAEELRDVRKSFLEDIATAAVRAKDFDLAVRAHADQAYPNASAKVAKEAVSQHTHAQYLEAILRSHQLLLDSKINLIDETLWRLEQNKLSGGTHTLGPTLQKEIETFARDVSIESIDGTFFAEAGALLAHVGAFRAARETFRGQPDTTKAALESDIIQHKAYYGQLAEATEDFVRMNFKPNSTNAVYAGTAIIANALWHQDDGALRIALKSMTDVTKLACFPNALKIVGTRTTIPKWAIKQVYGKGYRPSVNDVVAYLRNPKKE